MVDLSFVIGIDGGGTRTRAVVVNEKGTVIGLGLSGPSDFDAVGFETAKTNLHSAIMEAVKNSLAEITSIHLGIAGVVSEKDNQIVSSMLEGLEFSPTVTITISHDCRTALAGAIGKKQGLVLISGTGSAVFGRNAKGDEVLSGGWGYLFADVGSGYYLGHQALTAVLNAYDGRQEPTALTQPVLEALQINDIMEVMHRIYHPRIDTSAIAALAPIVTKLAETDNTAMKIIQNGCKGLADVVGSAVKKLQFEGDYHIVAAGGLATSQSIFSEILFQELRESFPTAILSKPMASPLTGAVIIALENLGVEVNDELIGKIESEVDNRLVIAGGKNV